MQSDGYTEGEWTLEMTRPCIECGGTGHKAHSSGGDPMACPACVHGKDRTTITIAELRKLLAQSSPG